MEFCGEVELLYARCALRRWHCQLMVGLRKGYWKSVKSGSA